MSVYSLEDPGSGPQDGCCLSVLTSKKLGDWVEMEPERYLEEKQKYGERILESFFDRFPKARGHVEEYEIFTPVTLMHFMGTQEGAIYGEDTHFKDLLSIKLDARSPIKGLYFCGASLIIGGFNTTLESGNIAAKLALKDIAKEAH
jgi:phytoene dehydrogenase-like protein